MVKLAISNIAWSKEYDEKVYNYLAKKNVEGLEIAPTRIFLEEPYEHLKEAKEFAQSLKYHYGLLIPSMQSIWFGKKENIFRSKEERKELLKYTQKAICFAEVIECKNVVFGCPKNRCFNKLLEKEENEKIAEEFFALLADYAKEHNTVLAIEANHISYGTDFINTTFEALQFVKHINSEGLRLNLDTGNLLQNAEHIDVIANNVNWINHVHFSEPGLEALEERALYAAILKTLTKEKYQRFIAIEMKNQGNIEAVEKAIALLLKEIEEL